MERTGLIKEITRRVQRTHSPRDLEDLKTFSDEELIEILKEIIDEQS